MLRMPSSNPNFTERTPVIIFLSDGECSIKAHTVRELCRSAVHLGSVLLHILSCPMLIELLRKPLSFHAVSFGEDSQSSSLRQMVQIALDIQSNAPQNLLVPAASIVLSSYSQALDTVGMRHYLVCLSSQARLKQIQLAETFIGIAESLRKPRGSLLR